MKAHFEKVSFEQYRADRIRLDKNIHFISSDIEAMLRAEYDAIQLPKRATEGSAGYDFYIPFHTTVNIEQHICPTGIRFVCEEPDKVLMLYPRSGLGMKYVMRLTNSVGVIDRDYMFAENEGHIMAGIISSTPFDLRAGDRFMQGIILPYCTVEDDEPTSKDRTGGMGSTGR